MDDFFSLPRRSNNTAHSTIAIPASPTTTSSNTSSPHSPSTQRQQAPKFGRGNANNNNNTNNASNKFSFTEHEEQPPVYAQRQLGKNAFLPKVENDGEWKMVANPWEMI